MEGNYLNLTRNTTHKGESFGYEELTWGNNSWPARNYACSFCKREFKSAQALGGHMNVHRRDRARLRSSLSSLVSDQCPPPPPNPKPNPNPNNNNNQTHLSVSPSSSYNLSDALLNCSHSSPLYCPCPCLTLSSSVLPPPAASTSGDKKPRLTTPLSPDQSREELVYKMSNNNNNSNTTRSFSLGGVDQDHQLKGCCAMEDELRVFNNINNEHNITLELGIGLFNPKENLDLELRLGH